MGEWARVEGTPCDPNPNKPFAKMENLPLFNVNGKLNPSITILGKERNDQLSIRFERNYNIGNDFLLAIAHFVSGTSVSLAAEKILLNSIVLPHKELTRNYKNEIIL